MRWLAVVVVLAIFLGGCAYSISPVTGMLFTSVKAPLAVTEGTEASQVGKASCYSLFGLIAVGDASIETAAKNGNITKIHHVDYESSSFIGIFANFTTVVYGD